MAASRFLHSGSLAPPRCCSLKEDIHTELANLNPRLKPILCRAAAVGPAQIRRHDSRRSSQQQTQSPGRVSAMTEAETRSVVVDACGAGTAPAPLRAPVARPRTAIIAAAAAPATSPEAFPLSRSSQLAGGRLDLVKWKGDRMLRIWTPPGYSLSRAAQQPYPVVYLNDGQNLFDDRATLSGHSWRAADTAAGLISSGALSPFVIVGIDHAGAMRSYDYLPYPPGNAGGYRLDADKWPGGGVDAYLRAVVDEILPYAERTYGVSQDPALRIFGGSSFGGICALCAALRAPGVFGSLLVESPSLWFGEERLLRQDLPDFSGPWPARVFLAMGTKEYSAIRGGKESDFDARLVGYTHELAALLERRGLVRGKRLQVEVEEGATHNERAWAGRLPAALRFLGAGWRQADAAAAGGN